MQKWQAKPLGYPKWSGFTWNFARSRLKPFAWNLGTTCILYLEPLPGTLEPSLGTCLEPLNRNPYVEQWNLHVGLWLGISEPRQTSTRNLRNLLGTLELLGTLTLDFFGTFWNLYLKPLLGNSWNLHLEPRNLLKPLLQLWNLPEPLLGTLTWNLGTLRNLVGWLPQSAPGPSLAETLQLSAVWEKYRVLQVIAGNIIFLKAKESRRLMLAKIMATVPQSHCYGKKYGVVVILHDVYFVLIIVWIITRESASPSLPTSTCYFVSALANHPCCLACASGQLAIFWPVTEGRATKVPNRSGLGDWVTSL